ncbi:MAG: ribbon-helix-helix domain-containing protein [Acidimicrobiia bacterium]
MKLSVSVPEDDVEFIDAYAATHGLESRSGVVQRALSLLRSADLGQDYAAAWAEWENSGDAELWDATVGDGLSDEAG